MHLLTKQQVVARKNDEERVASRQGMELATRVDGLRKQNLEEEKKMTVNRELMLGIIQEELETARQEKEALKAEVRQLTEARITLQKPLDDEWKALRIQQASWQDKVVEIDIWKLEMTSKEREITKQMDIVNENLQSSLELKKEAEDLKAKNVIQNNEVTRLSKNLSKDIEIFTNKRNDETVRLNDREAKLDRKEEELKNKQENLNLKERELNLLKLKWQMLTKTVEE